MTNEEAIGFVEIGIDIIESTNPKTPGMETFLELDRAILSALKRCKRIDEAHDNWDFSHTENYRLGWNECLEWARGDT